MTPGSWVRRQHDRARRVSTVRDRDLSDGGPVAPAAALLGVGSVLPFLGFVVNGEAVLVPAIICFLLGWFALGVQAIRLDRPIARAEAA